MKRLLAAALVLAMSGCAVLFTDRLPADHRVEQPVECSSSESSSWGDILGAVPGGLLAFEFDKAGTPFAVWSAIHLLSAGAGFYWHAQCRHAERAHTAWQKLHPVRPPPSVSPGQEDQVCFPNRTCNSPLVCELSRCRVAPERGAVGGECYPNLTCDTGAHCDRQAAMCAAGSIGSAGAPCYRNHTCDLGLSCEAELCQHP